MGHSEFWGGQHVSVYVARAWGDAIVATWVETQGRAAVSGARGGAGIGNDALRDVRFVPRAGINHSTGAVKITP
jgi:hypothetical protein